MNTFVLDPKNKDSARYDFYEANKKSDLAIVLIDGFPGNRLVLKPLAMVLTDKIKHVNVACVSFEGSETDMFCPPKIQYQNLKRIILDLNNRKNIKQLSLVCTSMGSISAVLVSIDKGVNKYIKSVLFLDPADYVIDMESKQEGKTWDGNEKYDPDSETFSSLLNKVSSDVKIHVVNFTLRNCINGQYVSDEERSTDNPNGHSRLNNEMVESFFERTPLRNRGFYVEDHKLPHAFLRDGNIEKNLNLVEDYIAKVINKSSKLVPLTRLELWGR